MFHEIIWHHDFSACIDISIYRWFCLRSPTLIWRYSTPSLMEMRACLLNTIVAPLLVGLVNLAKKMPAIMAEMMTPVMLWTHIVMMAKEQRPVVARPPYL